jgi:alkanesulfonate monooxygenase SsuD/methylene tetrahydromethanopterin reductase-like flavin-dependent oxidoreductase (luciferase family)
MEMTGELANGWIGTSFVPEHADVFMAPLQRGLEKSGRTLSDLDIQVGGSLEISDDVERLIEARRPAMAFTLGGMGSAQTNFYNDAFSRAGYEEDAKKVQALWVSGKKEEAIRAVPDEMVLKTNLIGTREMVIERIKAYAAVGVTTLRVSTTGANWKERTESLAEATDLVHSISV